MQFSREGRVCVGGVSMRFRGYSNCEASQGDILRIYIYIYISWNQLKGCYWAAVNCAPPTAGVTFERITADRTELYSYDPLTGANILISVEPFPVDESVPTEDKIEWAVKRPTFWDAGRTPERLASGGKEEGEGGGCGQKVSLGVGEDD